MRKSIIVGNWKMYKTATEAVNLTKELIVNIPINVDIEIIVCPPFTSLYSVGEIIKGSKIKLGAQNCYIVEEGAYTGEISPLMLKNVNCDFVIIGHSERRQYFKETNELVNQKIKLVLKSKLTPIMCIGENLEERETNKTFKIIKNQLLEGLVEISYDEASEIIIAYEPVWAIGTGKTATSLQAEEVHLFIRNLLKEKYDLKLAEKVRILYGGSVKPDNIRGLMNELNIDGALVGGASLNAKSFVEIINNAK